MKNEIFLTFPSLSH